MQPVAEPVSAYVERERPNRVHLRTVTDDSNLVVREPRVRDEILRGYSLIERCEAGRPQLRTSCVHQVDAVAIPVQQVLRLSAPQMSGSRTFDCRARCRRARRNADLCGHCKAIWRADGSLDRRFSGWIS